MLNDKTNKLLISKAAERHVKSAQWQCRVFVCVWVYVCICICVYRVASRQFPARSGVQARAQSNHSSVNILYYYNLGYAFNCACHKRLIHTHTHKLPRTHTHTTTHTPPTLEQLLLPLCQALSSMSCSWWAQEKRGAESGSHNPFVSACICDGNVAEKCG